MTVSRVKSMSVEVLYNCEVETPWKTSYMRGIMRKHGILG